ncbi:MAG: hypothetical protein AABY53_02200 [Bdellovibrionota bacterium]
MGFSAQAEFCKEIPSENAGSARYQQLNTAGDCTILISRSDEENVKRSYVFRSDGSLTVSTHFPGKGSDSANSNVKTFFLLPRTAKIENFGIKSTSAKFIEINLASGGTARINVSAKQPKIENLEGFNYYENPVITRDDYNNADSIKLKP